MKTIKFTLKPKALEQCKTICESQTDVVNFLEEQVELAGKIHKEAPSSDRSE